MWGKKANWYFSLISPLTLICWEAQISNWCDHIIHVSLSGVKVLCYEGMQIIWEMFWITSLLVIICDSK